MGLRLWHSCYPRFCCPRPILFMVHWHHLPRQIWRALLDWTMCALLQQRWFASETMPGTWVQVLLKVVLQETKSRWSGLDMNWQLLNAHRLSVIIFNHEFCWLSEAWQYHGSLVIMRLSCSSVLSSSVNHRNWMTPIHTLTLTIMTQSVGESWNTVPAS